MTFPTAPMVTTRRNEHRVAKGELGLRDVAGDEVTVMHGERRIAEFFAGEQETGAAIHQQTRRFVQRETAGIAVGAASYSSRCREP